MDDRECVAFLHWCLPRLGLRWSGYRKVRRLVGKRLNRRLAELGLTDLCAYRAFLTSTPAEWARLDVMCRIPISRFYRDRGAFDVIIRQLLPQLAAMASARGMAGIKCWSAGCASGEEPYTLSIGWRLCVVQNWPTLQLAVIATDADKTMIERAKAACYSRSSLKDLPQEWVERAFIPQRAAVLPRCQISRGSAARAARHPPFDARGPVRFDPLPQSRLHLFRRGAAVPYRGAAAGTAPAGRFSRCRKSRSATSRSRRV